jgi:hypothetical protein
VMVRGVPRASVENQTSTERVPGGRGS